ncbi:hypothetical protein QDY65_00935 [Pyrococcus kukulkanii]|uniref:hypothetical protein n=1 Tax=Pyrococcus kukulkanii TaxID=1609559 RepID=UPI003562A26E
MVEFLRLLNEGWEYTLRNPGIMVIPVIASIISLDSVVRVVNFHGNYVGIRITLPEALPTLWSFVSPPGGGLSTPLSLLFGLLVAVISAYLSAGFLGSINGNEFSWDGFLNTANRYFLEFLKFGLLLFLVSLGVGTLVFLGPPGLIFAFAVVIGIGYFLYATPYLIILQGVKAEEAIGKSLNLALSGGEYLEYAVKYGGLTLLLSIPMTLITVNLKVVGLLPGLLIVAPLAVMLSRATLVFFKDLSPQG